MSPVAVFAPQLSVSALQARLRTSEGSRGAAEMDALPFEAGARLARGSWSPVAGSRAQVRREEVAGAATTIALAQFRPELLEGVKAIEQLSSVPERSGDAERQLNSVIGRLVVALRDVCGWTLRGDVLGSGFKRGPGGLSNTTLNPNNSRYVGLHLDSWDRLPARERHRGQNRVCLNLGSGPRGLQFVPLTAMEMSLRLDDLGSAVVDRCGGVREGDLARRFLRCFPYEPVLRITTLPGEAYIAPTENVVHDGCTLDTSGPDVTLTIRGHFEPS
jgi:hypothetical protein